MFDIKVTGIFEASMWVKNNWPTHIVSLVDPTINFEWNHPNHCVVRMHDIEKDFGPKWIFPNSNHVEQVLEFTKNLDKSSKLLVHCHQGLSRSTATAIGVCVQHGMTAEQAFFHIEKIRPVLLPNSVILKIIDEKFNLKGDLVYVATEYRKREMIKTLGPDVNITRHADVVEMKSILEKIKKF